MQNSYKTASGILFVIATPIGNLKDVTFRAIETLQSVDLIACEDTRTSLTFLNKYNIKKRLISFHKYSKKERVDELIGFLKQGLKIGLITDAGTPGISDPGAFLVKHARENNIKVVPIPGPSALTSAVSISGICEKGFVFIGFLPSITKNRDKLLKRYASIGLPLVFYESPRRLLNTLEFIKSIEGNTNVFVFKELTKLHEDYFSGSIQAVIEQLKYDALKGEYTIILETGEDSRVEEGNIIDKKAFLTIASSITGLSKREVYKKLFTK
ncbi:MAG: 16S rRNA (cytidine(1402)-2'-O)-methyltransferase [bacterium]